MSVIILAAYSNDRVIGINGKLPWHISEDLKRFKKITTRERALEILNEFQLSDIERDFWIVTNNTYN